MWDSLDFQIPTLDDVGRMALDNVILHGARMIKEQRCLTDEQYLCLCVGLLVKQNDRLLDELREAARLFLW